MNMLTDTTGGLEMKRVGCKLLCVVILAAWWGPPCEDSAAWAATVQETEVLQLAAVEPAMMASASAFHDNVQNTTAQATRHASPTKASSTDHHHEADHSERHAPTPTDCETHDPSVHHHAQFDAVVADLLHAVDAMIVDLTGHTCCAHMIHSSHAPAHHAPEHETTRAAHEHAATQGAHEYEAIHHTSPTGHTETAIHDVNPHEEAIHTLCAAMHHVRALLVTRDSHHHAGDHPVGFEGQRTHHANHAPHHEHTDAKVEVAKPVRTPD
jgi:hypothetical protein